MNGTEWAMLFGTLTLMCWMGAGFVAVILDTKYESRNEEMRKGSEVIKLGLTALGLVSAFAMAAAIVLL
ncbi:hypothetical protein [Rhizobium indicum]|uniref:DUF350 domain-containing protein n=2 Tax=Rhizobium TaxID=379 RepID=A0ABX6PNR0_9HYPH|nr:hypothetical protein [Rhizobium indicum]NNU64819.1 hypothetical protein [Rhizobium sp. WYCCWR 11152]QKK20298.1 hypothetical protein FFM53_028160 [Rhizobium indicum]